VEGTKASGSRKNWPLYVLKPRDELYFPPKGKGGSQARPGFSVINESSTEHTLVRVSEDLGTQRNVGHLFSVFMEACDKGDMKLLEELVPLLTPEQINGRHPCSDGGKAAVHWAVRGGCLGCVKLLVNAGALVNVTDECDRTPLHTAVSNSRTSIVKWLLQQGANVNAKCSRSAIPLHFAVSGDDDDQSDLVEMLLAAGSAVDARDDAGSTPAHIAQCSGGVEAVRR
jgi:ankyrin repeat protein